MDINDSNGGNFTICSCEHCGLGQTLPPPDNIELNRYYSDYYTEKGPPKSQKMLTIIKRALVRGTSFRSSAIRCISLFLATQMMQAILPVPFGNKKVLDIGCGYGRLLDLFQLQGWETYGVEPGIVASEWARRNGHKVVNSELEGGIFEDAYFSAIVLCHSLEHIREPVSILNEAYRILAPEGLLLVEVPNSACADACFFKEAWHAWHVPYHLYHWTTSSLELAVCNSGFIKDRNRFKIPKFRDFKANLRNLNNFRRISASAAFWHYIMTWSLGHIGINKEYYGHFIALYAHKPRKI